ncbi:hypothetical protein NQZ68_007946 [Dissostichus eleginoides]|nr:hypothetical protein NQZ68_007946 [Dissostichus eleginoides]
MDPLKRRKLRIACQSGAQTPGVTSASCVSKGRVERDVSALRLTPWTPGAKPPLIHLPGAPGAGREALPLTAMACWRAQTPSPLLWQSFHLNPSTFLSPPLIPPSPLPL